MQDYLIYNTLTDFVRPDALHTDYHIHLLCKGGTMSFFCNGKPFVASPGDFLIWQMTTQFTDIIYSQDFDADILMISNSFLGRYNPELIWATKGYMYIKANPVFHLKQNELEIISTDFKQFCQRIQAPNNLFKEEIVGSLLRILLYDMRNIYSSEIENSDIEDITSRHFLRFLMLVQEHCREQREVAWYASQLGLAPKYLSEISKSITGVPAGDWIDSYASQELRKLLSDQNLTLTDIVDLMHFSSAPALTRYMKRVMNVTPSQLRRSLFI